jgi:hypothetical protein
MSVGRQRDGGKEQFWRRMLRRWRGSGLSVRAFCHEHGLSEASFYGWRRTLDRRDAKAVAFVPAHIVPDEPVQARDQGPGCALELVLGAARVLRIGPGFDAVTLRRLLAVLEEGRP